MNETVLGALAENAIAMARRLQDPAALYSALNAGTQALRRPDQIRQRLDNLKDGDEIVVEVLRGGKVVELKNYFFPDLLVPKTPE